MIKRFTKKGFTIVELLVVIVVIGILAAITIVAYSGIQQRAQAASIADALEKIDKAFRLYGTEQQISTWWVDNALTGTGNPNISSVISSTGLKSYIQSEPVISGLTGSYFKYDNDTDTRDVAVCGSNNPAGVNIFFTPISAELTAIVDKIIDDNDTNCGKVRYYNDSQLEYLISGTQAF